MNEYDKVLETFRSHYLIKYGIKLDDEILYFFIRINEMHYDLKKDIKAEQEPNFKTGYKYFLLGMGQITGITLIAAVIFAAFLLIAHYS
jgi:hypothetical protein